MAGPWLVSDERLLRTVSTPSPLCLHLPAAALGDIPGPDRGSHVDCAAHRAERRSGRGGRVDEMRGDLARTNLPIPDRPHVGLVTYDAKAPNTSSPPIEPLRPPAGAPNVLIV